MLPVRLSGVFGFWTVYIFLSQFGTSTRWRYASSLMKRGDLDWRFTLIWFRIRGWESRSCWSDWWGWDTMGGGQAEQTTIFSSVHCCVEYVRYCRASAWEGGWLSGKLDVWCCFWFQPGVGRLIWMCILCMAGLEWFCSCMRFRDGQEA